MRGGLRREESLCPLPWAAPSAGYDHSVIPTARVQHPPVAFWSWAQRCPARMAASLKEALLGTTQGSLCQPAQLWWRSTGSQGGLQISSAPSEGITLAGSAGTVCWTGLATLLFSWCRKDCCLYLSVGQEPEEGSSPTLLDVHPLAGPAMVMLL